MAAKIRIALLLCFGIFWSCEQVVDVNYHQEDLIGTWRRVEVIPSGLSEADFRYFDMERRYTFNSDATCSYLVNFYGFKDENPNEIIGRSKTTGTFQVRADSLFIKNLQQTSWEKGFNPEPATVQFENAPTDGGRFDIRNDTLTLYYISYPADAPVQTQMSYNRVH